LLVLKPMEIRTLILSTQQWIRTLHLFF
jgi:hypothetical protein